MPDSVPADAVSFGARGPLVIIGVDGSGKDHVANLIVDETGRSRQRGWLAGRTNTERSTEHKTRRRLVAELLFIRTLPATRHVIPLAAGVLAAIDGARYRTHCARSPVRGSAPVLVSWTPLRVLAFSVARHDADRPKAIPRVTDAAFRHAVQRHRADALVVTVSDGVLRARLEDRERRGVTDQFDRHLLRDPEFASRFAATLTSLAHRYFPVRELDNDKADDSDVLAVIRPPTGADRDIGSGELRPGRTRRP